MLIVAKFQWGDVKNATLAGLLEKGKKSLDINKEILEADYFLECRYAK